MHHVHGIMSIVLPAVMLAVTVPLKAQNWPMAGQNRERTSSHGMRVGITPPLEKTAVIPVQAMTYPEGLTHHNGILFVAGESDPNRIAAIDPASGVPLWYFEIPNSGGATGVCPAVNDSLVYVGGQGGEGLYALGRATGIVRWSRALGSLYGRNPILDGGSLYLANDSLYCFDALSGAEKWSAPVNGRAYTPAVDGSTVYVPSSGRLAAIDKTNGALRWTVTPGIGNYPSVAVDGEHVYFNERSGITALRKSDAHVVWQFPLVTSTKVSELGNGAFALTDSVLCFAVWNDAAQRGILYALDRRTGAERWHVTFETAGVMTPAIADGVVYTVHYGAQTLYGFSLADGSRVFSDTTDAYAYQPIIADGTLYAPTVTSIIMFRTRMPTSTPAVPPAGLRVPRVSAAPNPFSRAVSIRIDNPVAQHATVVVQGMLGREVATLLDAQLGPGTREVTWNGVDDAGRPMPPGVYVLSVLSGAGVRVLRIALIR